MKLVSLNIEGNKHYERFIPFLEKENPDVICMQEVLEEDFEFLKEKLHMQGIYKPQAYVCNTSEHYRNTRGKHFGVAVFAKNILDSGYVFYWGKEESTALPFEEYYTRQEELRSYVLLWVDIQDASGAVLRFASTHYPISTQGESSAHQLEVIAPFLEKLDELKDFVVCGDFNAPRGNETFRRIAEKYHDNIPVKYVTSLDQNLHRVKGLMFMVDCLFSTQAYHVTDVSLVDGLSDHMAIVATVNLV
jgi:endonuclease/exonuclease/phosphatase family metal-dependent hydrolase